MRAPYFVEYVRQELLAKYGADRLYRDGLEVTTTLDWKIQDVLEQTLEQQLRKLERINRYEVVRDSTWTRPESTFVTSPYLQGAAIVLETATGEIVAMVGGRDYWESKFNRATQALRQPGSAFKPFVYTAAVEHGIGPSTIILDEPLVVPMPSGKPYKPENTKRNFQGPMTMRFALSHSVNVPAVRTILEVGPAAAVEVGKRCGFRTRILPYPSTALGACEVYLIDLASAYTVFPNLGILEHPWGVREVRDRNGSVLERGMSHTEEALSAPVAAVVSSMLQEVMRTGTGASVRGKGFTVPAGGKTGTMDDYMDACFVGYTPLYTMAVWVGFDVKKTLGRDMTGTAAALPVWIEVMKMAHEGKDVDAFEIPSGVVWKEVCSTSGALGSAECPQPYREIFVMGDEPKQLCPVHHEGSALEWGDEISFEAIDRRKAENELGDGFR
jgi:penicillin-binding protein 1A